jgi:hypothetical protein
MIIMRGRFIVRYKAKAAQVLAFPIGLLLTEALGQTVKDA